MSDLQVPTENGNDFLYNLLKGGIGSIGGFAAAEIFGLIVSAPISLRREKWMNDVVKKLNEIDPANKSFIIGLQKNDEFISFLMESTQIAIKNHQDLKIEILKNTIKNFFLQSSVEFDKKHSFLKIIDQLSPTHIKITRCAV